MILNFILIMFLFTSSLVKKKKTVNYYKMIDYISTKTAQLPDSRGAPSTVYSKSNFFVEVVVRVMSKWDLRSSACKKAATTCCLIFPSTNVPLIAWSHPYRP